LIGEIVDRLCRPVHGVAALCLARRWTSDRIGTKLAKSMGPGILAPIVAVAVRGKALDSLRLDAQHGFNEAGRWMPIHGYGKEAVEYIEK
jgi:hypothetical protein